MPELPEVELYLHALRPRVVGEPLEGIRVRSPSLLRTVEPPLAAAEGRCVVALRRIGKRIVFELDDELFLVVHLMIAGRFQWRDPGAPVPRKRAHAAFDFPEGSLILTEASTKKRASLHLFDGRESLRSIDPGGIEPLEVNLATFAGALRRENRTMKRALTDPRLLSGIGNAHSDEILLEARLSPVKRTHQLTDEEIARVFEVARRSLREWCARLVEEWGNRFPTKVSAFHPSMKAHGRYGEPCPQCGSPIQRIVFGKREANYCAKCQTGGKLLKDRALSRLLREDWPRSLEELEERKATP